MESSLRGTCIVLIHTYIRTIWPGRGPENIKEGFEAIDLFSNKANDSEFSFFEKKGSPLNKSYISEQHRVRNSARCVK